MFLDQAAAALAFLETKASSLLSIDHLQLALQIYIRNEYVYLSFICVTLFHSHTYTNARSLLLLASASDCRRLVTDAVSLVKQTRDTNTRQVLLSSLVELCCQRGVGQSLVVLPLDPGDEAVVETALARHSKVLVSYSQTRLTICRLSW